MIGSALPRRCARQIEQHRDIFAPDRRTRMGGPEIGPSRGVGQGVLGKPADIGSLERMGGEFAAGGPAVEHERDKRNASEAPTLPIKHGAIGRTTSQSIPASSFTSFTTTSAGE